MSDYIQVITTVDNAELAKKIAGILVERNLAACAQVSGPITSIYKWKGKIENEQEWYCLIKTSSDLFGEVESAIKEIHPYEVPEIIALPIIHGSHAYLAWLGETIRR